jgi:hypothetical protein
MKLLFPLIGLLLVFQLRAGRFETSYGIGVITIEPYNYFSLRFWKDKKDKMPHDELYFQRDSGRNKLSYGFSTTGLDSVPAWFRPETFLITDTEKRIEMRCIWKDEKWCQVVVNNKTGELKWLELGVDVIFLDWGSFYARKGTIQIPAGKTFLYEESNAKSNKSKIRTTALPGQTMLIRALKTNGDWMYIEIIERDADMKEVNRQKGWIRWRDQEKPLIEYRAIN